MKYAFIARERAHFPLRVLCRVVGVSVSGFHDDERRKASPRIDPDATVRVAMRALHKASRGTYGRIRLVEGLTDQGFEVGAKRIRRLMREEGLCGRSKGRPKRATTNSAHSRPLSENVLERRFAVSSTVPAWVSDITHIPTREGSLYLAVVLNVQTRQVLGFSMADRMPDELVKRAFETAWSRFPCGRGVIFHSDRGTQYASHEFRRALQDRGFVLSMSRKGNCWDNAVAESFFATLKSEEALRLYATKQEAFVAINDYIHGFYNPTRLHSALGYRSPNDYARQASAA